MRKAAARGAIELLRPFRAFSTSGRVTQGGALGYVIAPLQGSFIFLAWLPRAMPWAIILRPLGAYDWTWEHVARGDALGYSIPPLQGLV